MQEENLEFSYVYIATALVSAAMLTYLSALLSIYIERKYGILCKDVHKPYEHFVPCIGGFPVYLGAMVGVILLHTFDVLSYTMLIVFISTTALGLAIGFLDDLFNLKSRWKIALGFLPAIPILAMGYYTPRPWVPFIGHTRLHIVYPILVLAASTVFTNGANMIDTHNGILPIFTLIAIGFGLILRITTGITYEEFVVVALIMAILAVYLMFNIYPAKMFNGNTGAFLMGSILMFITIFLRIEFYMLLTSIPMFINGFYYISSVKGFLQKEKVERPTYIDKNGCIYPSKQLYPITFIKMILIMCGKPLSEKELIHIISLVYLVTSFLSFIVCMALGYN